MVWVRVFLKRGDCGHHRTPFKALPYPNAAYDPSTFDCQVTFRGFRCKNLTFSRNLGGTGTVAAEGVRQPNVALPMERPGGGGRKAVLRLRRVYC